MVHRGQPLVGVEMGGQGGRILAALLGPGGQDGGLGIAPHGVGRQHLHPVAGGKDQDFTQAGVAMHQKFAEFRTFAQGERFPNFHSGGLMVEAKQVNLMLHRYIARNYGV